MAQRGFTLIELMVGVSILAILASLALPNFAKLIADSQVRSTADQLRDSIVRVRQEALKRNVPVTLAVKDGVGALSVAAFGASKAVDITSFTYKGTVSEGSVTLNGSGRAQEDATFLVSSPQYACKADAGPITCYKIQVFVGGAVRMCDPSKPVGGARACL
jgi:type IV fimbrial biogenesis protein FimT